MLKCYNHPMAYFNYPKNIINVIKLLQTLYHNMVILVEFDNFLCLCILNIRLNFKLHRITINILVFFYPIINIAQ